MQGEIIEFFFQIALLKIFNQVIFLFLLSKIINKDYVFYTTFIKQIFVVKYSYFINIDTLMQILYMNDVRLFMNFVNFENTNVPKNHLVKAFKSSLNIQNVQLYGCSNGFLFLSTSTIYLYNSVFNNINSSKALDYIDKSCIEISDTLEKNLSFIINSSFTGMTTYLNGSVKKFNL